MVTTEKIQLAENNKMMNTNNEKLYYLHHNCISDVDGNVSSLVL